MQIEITKKHNTAETSIQAFQILSNEGRLIDEKKACYEAIKKFGPITSRRLSELTKKERSNVTRSIYDLQNEIQPSIKVAFKKKCPVTGKNVKWYAVIDWQPPKFEQSEIF